MQKDKFVANFLYKQSIVDELEDRKKTQFKKDYEIIDSMIKDINQLGYDLKYETDLRMRTFNDKSLISIYKKYYLQFHNYGIAEDLLSMIDKKGFYESIPLVINLYEKIKRQEGLHQIASCDNAFANIKDKSSISVFLNYLTNEEDAIRLPLTMLMLAKWAIPDAKEYFLKYLENSNRELVFVALESLSYYDDLDNAIRGAIAKKLTSSDKDIVQATKRALKRLDKQKKK